jgi:hypothetical protein
MLTRPLLLSAIRWRFFFRRGNGRRRAGGFRWIVSARATSKCRGVNCRILVVRLQRFRLLRNFFVWAAAGVFSWTAGFGIRDRRGTGKKSREVPPRFETTASAVWRVAHMRTGSCASNDRVHNSPARCGVRNRRCAGTLGEMQNVCAVKSQRQDHREEGWIWLIHMYGP